MHEEMQLLCVSLSASLRRLCRMWRGWTLSLKRFLVDGLSCLQYLYVLASGRLIREDAWVVVGIGLVLEVTAYWWWTFAEQT